MSCQGLKILPGDGVWITISFEAHKPPISLGEVLFSCSLPSKELILTRPQPVPETPPKNQHKCRISPRPRKQGKREMCIPPEGYWSAGSHSSVRWTRLSLCHSHSSGSHRSQGRLQREGNSTGKKTKRDHVSQKPASPNAPETPEAPG